MCRVRDAMNASPPTLLAYGFRPFFLLTGASAVLLVAAWIGVLVAGLALPLGVNPIAWHAHEMLFALVPAAIAGFLLTAVPNWTGSAPLAGRALLALIVLWLIGRIAMATGAWWPASAVAIADLAFLPVLAAYLACVLLRHGNHRNLVLVALLLALACANLASHLAHTGVWPAGAHIGAVLALDLLAVLMLVIGGRITPAFTANWLRQQGRDASSVVTSPGLDRIALLSAALLVVADLITAWPAAGALAAGVAALANGYRLYRWRGWLAAREPLVWILHLGIAWVVLALALKAMTPVFALPASVWMHALGVGAVGTLLLGVMTRVALGHTGRALRLPRGAIAIYLLIQVAALARLAASLHPGEYRMLLVLTAATWIGAFVLFLAYFTPILARPRPDGRAG